MITDNNILIQLHLGSACFFLICESALVWYANRDGHILRGGKTVWKSSPSTAAHDTADMVHQHTGEYQRTSGRGR